MGTGSWPAHQRTSALSDWRLVLLVVFAVSVAYVRWHLGRGWIPVDDGPVAEIAERVMQGQLPHRDFNDLYTGGLTMLNAVAFRLLGVNLWTLRLVLFAFVVAWVPALFYIATRFVRPVAAAGAVMLAVVWSVPNYPAAMASWYNLFLATFGLAAVLRYIDVEHRGWLVAAGVAGGLSFLVKVIGLYYVAGVLLFLVFHTHSLSRAEVRGDDRASRGYAAFVSVSLLLFVGALFSLFRHQLHPSEVVLYFLPGTLISMLIARNEWREPAGSPFVLLARQVVPFLIGVVVPIAVFLVPFVSTGALGVWFHGVFIAPTQRFSFLFVPAQSIVTMLAIVPFAALPVLAHRAGGALTRRETVMLVLVLLLILQASAGNGAIYRTVWYAVRNLVPVLTVVGVAVLSRSRAVGASSLLLRSRVMLVLAVTAICSIVQYPWSVSLYFCYAAPLVVLSAVALYAYVQPKAMQVARLLVVFFIAFAVLRTNTTRIASLGYWYQQQQAVAPLSIDRGGIEVPESDARLYESLVTKLRAHARGGYTWASPDSPEVYFLSGLKNPTRTLFEVFDEPPATPEQVLHLLERHGITAVVLSAPSFSPPVSPTLYAALVVRYPHAQYVGPYQLRWRD